LKDKEGLENFASALNPENLPGLSLQMNMESMSIGVIIILIFMS